MSYVKDVNKNNKIPLCAVQRNRFKDVQHGRRLHVANDNQGYLRGEFPTKIGLHADHLRTWAYPQRAAVSSVQKYLLDRMRSFPLGKSKGPRRHRSRES